MNNVILPSEFPFRGAHSGTAARGKVKFVRDFWRRVVIVSSIYGMFMLPFLRRDHWVWIGRKSCRCDPDMMTTGSRGASRNSERIRTTSKTVREKRTVHLAYLIVACYRL